MDQDFLILPLFFVHGFVHTFWCYAVRVWYFQLCFIRIAYNHITSGYEFIQFQWYSDVNWTNRTMNFYHVGLPSWEVVRSYLGILLVHSTY